MKLLILGQNGQVGNALVSYCMFHNINYQATDRSVLDITSKQDLQNYFEKHHDFSFVVNATAYTAVDKAEHESELADAVNHVAVRNLAVQCEIYNLPVIHISTDYVFDGTKKTNYHEDDAVSPLGVYGVSKLKGEQALQEVCHKHIILRVSWVFGVHGNNFVKTMAKVSVVKSELGVVSDQYGGPTSASDIARVIIEICQSKQEHWGLYHYSGFPVTTWHQLAAAAIAEARKQGLDVKVKSLKAIRTEDYPAPTKRPVNSAFNTDKIFTNFNIKQASWQKDLSDVVLQLKIEMSE